jgi:hypothetical protein
LDDEPVEEESEEEGRDSEAEAEAEVPVEPEVELVDCVGRDILFLKGGFCKSTDASSY